VDDAFYVVCDERLNTEEDLAEGRVNVLVGLRSSRAGDYQSFLITHAVSGSSVRPVRSNWLPAGTRMSVHAPVPQPLAPDDDITVPRRTLSAAEALVRARRVSSRRTNVPIVPVVGPLAPDLTERSAATAQPETSGTYGSPGADKSAATPAALEPPELAAAARSLDRDDIARFYRDLRGTDGE
jgi:hypothetical protein